MKPSAELVRPRRLRKLSDEEIILWTSVAKGVARRAGAVLPRPFAEPKPASADPKSLVPVRPAATTPAKSAPLPLAPIDRKLKRALARGRDVVDDALDLHGLTQAEAHRTLRGFLRHAHARGARLVIVVTGKGLVRPSSARVWPDEPGVLKRVVPYWLQEADMRGIVLGFEEAGRAHGGSGALYVRLRRVGHG